MTQAQKHKVIEVIQNDAEIQNWYCDGEGRTCVLGGLLKKAGWLDVALRQLGGDGITAYWREGIVRALKDLQETYGLTDDQASELQKINDRRSGTERRREELINYVNSQRGEDENVPA